MFEGWRWSSRCQWHDNRNVTCHAQLTSSDNDNIRSVDLIPIGYFFLLPFINLSFHQKFLSPWQWKQIYLSCAGMEMRHLEISIAIIEIMCCYRNQRWMWTFEYILIHKGSECISIKWLIGLDRRIKKHTFQYEMKKKKSIIQPSSGIEWKRTIALDFIVYSVLVASHYDCTNHGCANVNWWRSPLRLGHTIYFVRWKYKSVHVELGYVGCDLDPSSYRRQWTVNEERYFVISSGLFCVWLKTPKQNPEIFFSSSGFMSMWLAYFCRASMLLLLIESNDDKT